MDTRALCGAWSFPATYDNIKTVQECIQEHIGNACHFMKGCSMFYDKEVIRDYVEEGMTLDEAEASIEQTVQAAKSASKVVYFWANRSVRLERAQAELVSHCQRFRWNF